MWSISQVDVALGCVGWNKQCLNWPES